MTKDTIDYENAQKEKLLLNEEGSPLKGQVSSYEKTIGLFKGISFIFGNIIGSGIFISVNATFDIFTSNNMLVVVLVWLIGGMIAMVGSLCYAELGGRYPATGGECVYYQKALSPKFSTLFAIMYVFVVKTITLAAAALTASKYFVNSLPISNTDKSEVIVKIVSVVVLSLCFVINSITKKAVTSMSVVFLVLKLTACSFIIFPGIYNLCKGKVTDWYDVGTFYSFDASKMSIALVNVLWSYEGWNTLGLIAGDIKKPEKNLLLSSVIGILMVVSAYILTVVSYTAVLGFDVVRSSETVALTFAKEFFGKFFWIISLLVTVSAIGSSNGTLYTLGGVTVYSGYNGMLPKFFSIVVRKTRIPVFSLFLITLISIGFTFFEYQLLLQYCSFVTWFFYFLSFVSLWILKVREKIQNAFQINYFFILIMMLICVYMVVMCFLKSLLGCSLIALFMLSIFGMQFIPCNFMENKKIVAYSESFSEKIMRIFDLEYAVKEDFS